MDQIVETLTERTAVLDGIGNQIPPLREWSKKSGFNTGLVVAAVLFVVGIITLFMQGWELAVLGLTVLYPSLHSIRAIESPSAAEKSEWLTYWMVFGSYHVIETFFGFIFWFIPYWSVLKVVGFLWMIMPQSRGAKYIYEKFVCGFLAEHKETIRSYIEMVKAKTAEYTDEARKAATDPANMAAAMTAGMKVQQAMAEPQEATPVADN